jgi:hypothetical protein
MVWKRSPGTWDRYTTAVSEVTRVQGLIAIISPNEKAASRGIPLVPINSRSWRGSIRRGVSVEDLLEFTFQVTHEVILIVNLVPDIEILNFMETIIIIDTEPERFRIDPIPFDYVAVLRKVEINVNKR